MTCLGLILVLNPKLTQLNQHFAPEQEAKCVPQWHGCLGEAQAHGGGLGPSQQAAVRLPRAYEGVCLPPMTPDLSQLNPNSTPDLSQLNPNFTPDLSQLNPNFTTGFMLRPRIYEVVGVLNRILT